jgi:hypothetical protein
VQTALRAAPKAGKARAGVAPGIRNYCNRRPIPPTSVSPATGFAFAIGAGNIGPAVAPLLLTALMLAFSWPTMFCGGGSRNPTALVLIRTTTGIALVGLSSDRTLERCLHGAIPIIASLRSCPAAPLAGQNHDALLHLRRHFAQSLVSMRPASCLDRKRSPLKDFLSHGSEQGS